MGYPPVAFYLFDENGIAIRWYGLIIAFGLAVGVFLGVREAKRRGYRSEMILDFLLIAIPLCIICARLYYVIFSWSEYVGDLLSIFAVWKGGLAIYGAVIGGVIAAFIFNRWRKVSIGELLDIGAPSLIIGQAIGRWGNFVNQEAFGLKTDVTWFPYSVYIEHPSFINGISYSPGYYLATFFYESMWDLLVFAALILLRKRIKIRGGIFALYVALYGFGRFFTESLRVDSLMATSDVRISQWLSAILFVCGIAFLIIMSRKKKEYPAYDGLYSLSWTDGQVEEYKKSRKAVKAEKEKPEAEKEKTETKEKPAKKKEEKAETKKKPGKTKEGKAGTKEDTLETEKKPGRKKKDSGEESGEEG